LSAAESWVALSGAAGFAGIGPEAGFFGSMAAVFCGSAAGLAGLVSADAILFF
jgi:hypothetical protein